MNDSYQAIYDAVRSRIGGADASSAIGDAARQCFDISHIVPAIAQEWHIAAAEHRRPSAVYRPRIFIDGNAWIALYGDNLQDGVAGCGDTPAEAMADFDANWVNGAARRAQEKAPAAPALCCKIYDANGLPMTLTCSPACHRAAPAGVAVKGAK